MIQINLFTAKSHNYRFKYTKFCVEQLTKIKKENLDNIRLHLYTDQNQIQFWTEELNKLKYISLKNKIHCMPNDS